MFKLEFNTDNAMFCNPDNGEPDKSAEACAIRRLLPKIAYDIMSTKDSGVVLDENGIIIGKWSK